MIVGQGEGHHAFEGQIARAELLDDLGRDTGEFEATAHQIDGNAKLQSDLVLAATLTSPIDRL